MFLQAPKEKTESVEMCLLKKKKWGNLQFLSWFEMGWFGQVLASVGFVFFILCKSLSQKQTQAHDMAVAYHYSWHLNLLFILPQKISVCVTFIRKRITYFWKLFNHRRLEACKKYSSFFMKFLRPKRTCGGFAFMMQKNCW